MIVIVSSAENDANPSTVWARGESRRHSGKKSRRKNKNTKPDPELILKQNILHTPSENFITGLSEKDIPKDWCEAKKLKMSIKHQGCRPRTIRNKYCVGQCNSFVIPNEESENSVFVSCSACKPHKTYYKHVTLTCPGQTPRKQRKRVTVIKECRCVAIEPGMINLLGD